MSRRLFPQNVVRRAHEVQTFDQHIYINHGTGWLYEQNSNERIDIHALFSNIRFVYSSDHAVIAKRKHVGAPLVLLTFRHGE